MLAIAYLALMFILGDTICRRLFVFVSVTHRSAAAFLTGLLIGSWGAYLSALLFVGTSSPLMWGNILFAAFAGLVVWMLRRRALADNEKTPGGGSLATEKWDLIVIGALLVLTTWMAFRTFDMTGGTLQIGHHEFPDFGPSVAIMQSFSEGLNFPTEHPMFAGERIRAYFLFYFQAGNLGYLGLNPALSNNILSILSTMAMLALVMTLGRVLFNSAVAGRIGAVLFFFHGSLAFIPFLYSQSSFAGLVEKLSTMTAFLNSTLPHRGEDWGVWSQNVFLTQRNLTSSIGILLIVLIFLVVQYRKCYAVDSAPDPDVGENEATGASSEKETKVIDADRKPDAKNAKAHLFWWEGIIPYVFSGSLLGLMAMWNGAVLVQGLLLLGVMWIVFPMRRQMLILIAAAVLVAIPQFVYLIAGARPATFSYLHWGYLHDSPSVLTVLYYLLFTFGFKWLLIGISVVFTGRFQRRFIAAVSMLIIFAFTTRLTEELLANHKFINIWLIIANVYVGYGLVQLWHFKISGTLIPTRAAAVVLAALVTVGGAIDLMPIQNSHFIEIKYRDDKLTDWVRNSTDPKAVFLSHRYMNHQILLAGRRLFFGTGYYVWEAGYDTGRREGIYRRMFESSDAAEVLNLLKENNISYVAIDDTIRSGRDFIKRPNEAIYQSHFRLVFEDTDNRYANMKIYEVSKPL